MEGAGVGYDRGVPAEAPGPMNRLYALGRYPFLLGFPYLADPFRVEGVENIPEQGPFLLLPNHQSALDPPLVQSYCPRPVHAMTKSTQFASPVFRWLLPRILAFPVRRYRVDPQAVRVALRLLGNGEGVCIYPEGERCWDGTLQPFRRGALRLMLAADVPVIPCGIDGMYDLWPRWAGRPRRGLPVTLRFGEPLRFGPFPDRAARDAHLPEAERRLRAALLELSGENRRRTGRSGGAGALEGEGSGSLAGELRTPGDPASGP
jgi:1-acyl-sn-glycerol-3-phosphate acyltransferase